MTPPIPKVRSGCPVGEVAGDHEVAVGTAVVSHVLVGDAGDQDLPVGLDGDAVDDVGREGTQSSVTRPPSPKVPSRVPLGLKRARAKSLLPLASLTPATRIVPSGWRARA